MEGAGVEPLRLSYFLWENSFVGDGGKEDARCCVIPLHQLGGAGESHRGTGKRSALRSVS